MTSVEKGWKKSADTQRMSTEDVIKQFKATHGDVYDYSNVVYVRNKDKVAIGCNEHGIFWQAPGDHKRGAKCPECSRGIMAGSKKKCIGDVMADFTAVHGDKYNYKDVHYISAWTPIKIICDIHGTFEQAPEHHRRGSGCPACTASGFNPLKPAILYYVKVTTESGTLYKVGITNRTVEERFGADMSMIEILKTWEYEIGADAYQAEQNILSINAEYSYMGPNILRSGNTELFTKDVGGFDYE